MLANAIHVSKAINSPVNISTACKAELHSCRLETWVRGAAAGLSHAMLLTK
jgi:hypothetical protein